MSLDLTGWARRLKAAKPGERFQEFYRDRRESRRSPVQTVLTIALGTTLVAAGLVALVAPGPGILLIALGGGLLGGESEVVARTLDTAEVKGRIAAKRMQTWWGKLPWPAKAALVLGGLMLGVAGVYVAWKVFVG